MVSTDVRVYALKINMLKVQHSRARTVYNIGLFRSKFNGNIKAWLPQKHSVLIICKSKTSFRQ